MESTYKSAADQAERRRIQADVIRKYRPNVVRFISRRYADELREDAVQVALIGVLVALERFDPSRGVAFWTFAMPQIRTELDRWLDAAVRWRPRVHGKVSPEQEELFRLQCVPASLNDCDDSSGSLQDSLPCDQSTAEEQLSAAQEKDALARFLSGLTRAELKNFFSKNGHVELRERARRFLRDNEPGQHNTEPVRRSSGFQRCVG